MSKAVVAIKSPRAETYVTVCEQLIASRPDITNFVWVFYGTSRDEDLVPASKIPQVAQSTITMASSPEQLSAHLEGADSLDVTGLPKEDFAQILPFVIGLKSLKAFTLTRTSKGTEYIDLLSHPTLSGFRRSYLGKLLFFRVSLVLVAAAFIGLAATQLVKTIPNAQIWTTWFGVFLGIVGVGMSFFSLRRE